MKYLFMSIFLMHSAWSKSAMSFCSVSIDAVCKVGFTDQPY